MFKSKPYVHTYKYYIFKHIQNTNMYFLYIHRELILYFFNIVKIPVLLKVLTNKPIFLEQKAIPQ